MRRADCMLFILAALSANVYAADGLGYLFTTPAQRAALDRLSLKPDGSMTAAPPEVAVTEDGKDAPPKKVKISGMIVSSHGKNTTWINHDGDKKVKSTGVSGGQVEVTLGADGKHISLKPGQEFDPGTGKISETYQGATATKLPSSGACRSTKTPEGDLHLICEPPAIKH
ncbi:MAG: hypothetical protein HY273_14875 [Gammaproteobacteria bacterium]|nr:hypothetical protein [Gammaproteobacteria bacterium]